MQNDNSTNNNSTNDIIFIDINDVENFNNFSEKHCNASSFREECDERVKELQNVSILSVLKKTLTGRFILKEYTTHGHLSDKSSKYLSNLIIDNILCDSTT